ncbi:hypothetical protein GO495_15150 [Chitinophaga oryziterrae]|uniref:Uncharacterized protein n=1 Tax=Chitinophaga oryziterrae TaxID=1031224 RepID=A0A6N8JC69_9BACT|nr:hypothetical protein [Chitinophaga oryziterrae]MVT41926.1 hypothetical protein [Chitinophaga oryziterrae]
MKKQLLKFGLMAGMGAFVLSTSFAKDVKATDTLTAMRDTATMTDTASFYRDTVSMKNDTASFVRDTASFVRDTALLKDTANFAFNFKADTATFKVADTATAFKSDTAAFKADTAMVNDTASFAAHMNAATGDTAAMKAIRDTAAFKKDTANVLGKNIVSFSKDTTTPQPTDTSKTPKSHAMRAKD